eukprot:139163-Chlamydomonas_euryale.AAC.3
MTVCQTLRACTRYAGLWGGGSWVPSLGPSYGVCPCRTSGTYTDGGFVGHLLPAQGAWGQQGEGGGGLG